MTTTSRSEVSAFVTGSRVYGTPRPDSDLDLVLLVEPGDLGRLVEHLGKEESDEGGGYGNDASIKVGKLNLIAVKDRGEFDAWREGTELLRQRRPVPREEAKQVLCELVKASREKTAGGL